MYVEVQPTTANPSRRRSSQLWSDRGHAVGKVDFGAAVSLHELYIHVHTQQATASWSNMHGHRWSDGLGPLACTLCGVCVCVVCVCVCVVHACVEASVHVCVCVCVNVRVCAACRIESNFKTYHQSNSSCMVKPDYSSH